MGATLAFLVCHPSATMKRFRPKFSLQGEEEEEEKDKTILSPSEPSLKKQSSKSKSKRVVFSNQITPSTPPPTLPNSTSLSDQSVTEISENQHSFGIVEAIFRSGWSHETALKIEKILKISHSPEILSKFEEYREKIRSKSNDQSERLDRLEVDGNELLRFHSAAITCLLGIDGCSAFCDKSSCGICRMIWSSFSGGKELAAFCENSQRAHEKVAVECAGEFGGRKAVVICRIVAGRIANYQTGRLVDGEDGGFDSAIRSVKCGSGSLEELMVLDSRAVLPCFLVLYDAVKP